MASGPREAEALKRFYSEAGTAPGPSGVAVTLDGRPVRTPAKAQLVAPAPVAEAVAAEWNAQGETIKPLSMPLTRLLNSAIDGVAGAVPAVQADVAKIAAGDLVLYRAEEPEGLVEAERTHWDPIVRFGEEIADVRLTLAGGIMPVTQDPRFEPAIRALLPEDPLPLAAIHQLATLTGSALTALAAAEGRLSFEEAWRAAHVDEDWNIAEWGEDAEAARRRALRERDAKAAHFVLSVS